MTNAMPKSSTSGPDPGYHRTTTRQYKTSKQTGNEPLKT
jgi:hypothetical protein